MPYLGTPDDFVSVEYTIGSNEMVAFHIFHQKLMGEDFERLVMVHFRPFVGTFGYQRDGWRVRSQSHPDVDLIDKILFLRGYIQDLDYKELYVPLSIWEDISRVLISLNEDFKRSEEITSPSLEEEFFQRTMV